MQLERIQALLPGLIPANERLRFAEQFGKFGLAEPLTPPELSKNSAQFSLFAGSD
jgi:hypothetical protein